MIILSEKFPGRILICGNCGCLFAYNENDIYGQDVYCPLCKARNTIDYDKNYDGIIKEEKKDVVQS